MADKSTELSEILDRGVDQKNRRIYFGNLSDTDEASSFSWGTVEAVVRAIHKMTADHPKKPIELHVSSEGGCVHDMLRLVDVIQQSSAKIIFVGSGEICSSAAYLMTTCDERILYPNTSVMLHEMSEGMGRATNTERLISGEESSRVQNILWTLLDNNSRMPLEFWKEVLQRDLYLTPEECLMLGLADKIEEPKKRGNLRKSRAAKMRQAPEKKELNRLIKSLYKRIHKGKTSLNIELHIPKEEFDKDIVVDDTPVELPETNEITEAPQETPEVKNTLINSNGGISLSKLQGRSNEQKEHN